MVFHFGRNLRFPNGLRYWLSSHVFICSLLDLWWGIPSSLCRMSLGVFFLFFFFHFWVDRLFLLYTTRSVRVYFWILCPRPWICLSVAGPGPHCFYCCSCFSVMRAYFIGLREVFPSFSKWCSVSFKYFIFSSTLAQFLLSFPRILVRHWPEVTLNELE